MLDDLADIEKAIGDGFFDIVELEKAITDGFCPLAE